MLIDLKNVQKTYATKTGVTFRALSNISTSFDNTGLVFLVGQSGSGKSTLLNVIGGLDSFDSGELTVAGRPMRNLSAREVDSFRNTLIGFVFQEFNLIDTLSVAENVRLALDMQDGGGAQSNDAVMSALEQMGIADKAKNKTKDLSGGQRQRVAIARALVKDPRIILADEPTGALDSATGEEIFGIFKKLSADRLVIIVTHDLEKAAQYGDRIIEMKDGRIYRDVRRKAEGEPPEPECVQIVSDTLVRIDPGQNVGDADIERINEIIADSGRKTFLSFETDGRKVKAMFPNLRDAVDGNEAAKAEEDAAAADDLPESETVKEKFVPYKSKNEPTPEFEYKKSKLPASKTLKLGLTNLNHKKVRLALTIIMSILAFALFGVSQSFNGYDVQRAISNTVTKENYSTVAFINGAASADNMTRMRQSDIDALAEDNPLVNMYSQYNLTTKIGSVNFKGVVEVDDVSKIGHPILAGSGIAPDYDSVIISQFAALELVSKGIIAVSNVSEAVGHTVSVSGRTYVITGIIASDMNKYDGMSEMDKAALKQIADSIGDYQLFVKPGFIENYVMNLSYGSFEMELDIGQGEKYYQKPSVRVVAATDEIMDSIAVNTSSIEAGSMQISGVNDIYLSNDSQFLSQLFIKTEGYNDDMYKTIDEINNLDERRLTITSNSLPVYASNAFQIVGLITDVNGDLTNIGGSTVMVHKNVFAALYRNIIYPAQVIAQLPGDEQVTRSFVSSMYDAGFKINSVYVGDYDMVLTFLSVLRYVVLGLSLALCLLVVVLLYSFISSSIRSTKKQIGILRALGAKQSDTFKIYAGEGFIVTVFAYAVASVLLAVVAPLLNLVFSKMYGYYFSLISIAWWVYVIMAAVAVLVTLVAVLIPLRKFNKITPISAISQRD